MPRKGENIYKRKDGRWEGRYIKRRNGKKAIYGYVYAKNYSEVKRKLNLKRTETIQEIKLEKTLQKDISFTTIAKFWLMSIKPSVKESTWIKYRNTLNCQIIPRIGVKNISEIDYETVFGICSDMLSINKDVGKGLSSKTVSDALSIIKAIIKYAERMKFITDRTALDVSVKLKTSQLRVFSHVEEQILFEYLSEKLDYTNLGILICMFTGIRIGQMFYQKYAGTAEEELKVLCCNMKASQVQVLQYQQMIEELNKITNCPACGTEVVEGAIFCYKCGANLKEWKTPLPIPQHVKVCEYCGALLEKGNVFCVNCGKPVGGKKASKKKICPVCRCEAEPDQTFCTECGAELGD